MVRRCRVLDRVASSLTEKIPFLMISSKSCSFCSSVSATFLIAWTSLSKTVRGSFCVGAGLPYSASLVLILFLRGQ